MYGLYLWWERCSCDLVRFQLRVYQVSRFPSRTHSLLPSRVYLTGGVAWFPIPDQQPFHEASGRSGQPSRWIVVNGVSFNSVGLVFSIEGLPWKYITVGVHGILARRSFLSGYTRFGVELRRLRYVSSHELNNVGEPSSPGIARVRKSSPRSHQFLCIHTMTNVVQGVSAAAVTKMLDENPQHPRLGPCSPNSVYPACTSLGRIRCFWRFSRLIESITYAFSTSLLVRSPPPLPN